MTAEIKISNIRRVPIEFEEQVRGIYKEMTKLYDCDFAFPQILMADIQLTTDRYTLRDMGLSVGGRMILSSSLVLDNRDDGVYVSAHELSEKLFGNQIESDGIVGRKRFEDLQSMKSAVRTLECTGDIKKDDYMRLLEMYRDCIYSEVFREGSAEAITLHTLSSMNPYKVLASDKRQKVVSGHRSVLAHKVFGNRNIFSSLDGLIQDVETMITDDNVQSYMPQMNQQIGLIEGNIPVMRTVQTEYGFVLADRIFGEYGSKELMVVADLFPPNKAIYFEGVDTFLDEFGERIDKAIENKKV